MKIQYQDLLRDAYSAFNARDIDKVLLTLHPKVCWSNGWEGGYVYGHEGVRDYWQRQWKELDPHVEPTGFEQLPDGRINVQVHQHVKDLAGNILFDGTVQHIYTIENGLIRTMEIVGN